MYGVESTLTNPHFNRFNPLQPQQQTVSIMMLNALHNTTRAFHSALIAVQHGGVILHYSGASASSQVEPHEFTPLSMSC
jgi:hypothetical protein